MSDDQILGLVWLCSGGIYIIVVSCILLFIYKMNDGELQYTITYCLMLLGGVLLGPVGVRVALTLFSMHIFEKYDLGYVFNKRRAFKSKSRKLKDELDEGVRYA